MKKYIFTIIAVLLLTSAAFGVASNRRYYHITIFDQWGEVVTSPAITQIDVQNESGTAVAVYSTSYGSTEVGSTGVITTGLADGTTEFWYADTAIDLTVTDGTRTYEIESFSVRTARFMLPSFLKAVSSSNFGQTDDLDFTYGSWVIDGDTSNRLDMIPDNDGAILAIGDGTTQADVYMYSASTASYWLFDEGAGEVYYQTLDIQLDDDAYLILGDDDDVTVQFDGTNLELFAAAVDTPFAIGGITYGFELTYYFEGAGQFRTDYDADFINLTDDMELRFGTGASSDGDIKISSNSSNVLEIEQVVLDTGTIQIGVDNRDIPIKWFAETASSYFQLTGDDVNIEAMNLALGDGDAILLGDALGTGAFTISSTSAVLTLAQVSADTGTIVIGADGTDVPITWNGETASANLILTGDTILIDGMDMTFEDGDFLKFGDDSDWTITSATTKILQLTPAGDETYAIYVGADTAGADLLLYGATTGEKWLWDSSLDYMHLVGDKTLMTLTGTTAPFKVDATGTVTGAAITLETTDGGLTQQIDGSGNGDWVVNVGDDATITVTGDYTLAVTGTTTLPDDVLLRTVVAVTANEADNLAATQKELVAAVAGKTHEFVKVIVALDYGATAYTESDDNLVVRYTDGSGVIVSDVIEATGLADATADTVCFAGPAPTTSALVAATASTNQALVLDNSGNGEWGGSGDSPLVVITYYRTHTTAELGM